MARGWALPGSFDHKRPREPSPRNHGRICINEQEVVFDEPDGGPEDGLELGVLSCEADVLIRGGKNEPG